MKKLKIRVPATSANLGPGYDCMGLALGLYSDFTFEESERLIIEGCPEEFRNEDNLVVKAFKKAYEYYNKKAGAQGSAQISLPALKILIESQVPVARGLGSSATCTVAGVLAVQGFLGNPFTSSELLMLCTELEGHPDNAAPCLFGGLTASFMEDGMPHVASFDCHEDWRYVTVIPDYEVKTSEARKVVKQDIRLSDGVYSVSHALCMVKALETGDSSLLGYACRDVLHEPYRKGLIKDYDSVREVSLDSGADAFFISGSGSTMIAMTRDEEVAEKIQAALRTAFPAFDVLILEACKEGAAVI